MGQITLEFYGISIPREPIKAERYDAIRAQINSGTKIDFYGTPQYAPVIKKWGIKLLIQLAITAALLLIFCLFTWSIKYEYLGGYIVLNFFGSLITFFLPIVTFVHMRSDISIFNKKVAKLVFKYDTFDEFNHVYYNKYYR